MTAFLWDGFGPSSFRSLFLFVFFLALVVAVPCDDDDDDSSACSKRRTKLVIQDIADSVHPSHVV